ncbi:MAG: NAD(P)-dependent oxidoreductase [Hyphomicrobiaceae bacterium]|nr:NAD(P)-dependent oxidoreductase [Hyphomicrobiaceae bacterium]
MAIGFVGVGNMGLPMAEKLIGAIDELVVQDIREDALKPLVERQARPAATVREVGDRCGTAFVSLPTLPALREVVVGSGGLIEGKALKLVVNTCTVGVPLVEELETALAAKGIGLVDCPISGGPPGARAGTLSVMVSGRPDLVEQVRPLISRWGPVTVAGDRPGLAQVLKLTNNILSAVSLAATCEAYVMGAKGGLDPEVMTEAINRGSGRNSATQDKIPRSVLNRTFAYGAPMHILAKDVILAIEQGERLGIPMWVCQAAANMFKHEMFAGKADKDITELIKTIERGAGFVLPKTR